MKTKTLLVLTLVRFLTLPALAEPESLGTVKLADGSQLEDVKLLKVEPDGLRLEHRSGVARVPLEDLPEDLARRFSLDEATDSYLSVFAQDNWRIGTKLRLLAGLRWDDNDDWGAKSTGRIDFSWRVAETFELRGGYGQA